MQIFGHYIPVCRIRALQEKQPLGTHNVVSDHRFALGALSDCKAGFPQWLCLAETRSTCVFFSLPYLSILFLLESCLAQVTYTSSIIPLKCSHHL